jgi:hypothetical protein
MASIWDKLFSGEDYRTAAPSGGYADLYANGLLGNRTDTPTSVGAMETGKDFIPGIGDAIALKEAYDAASRGDKVAAGLLAAGAAVGLIPGAGDALARPVMAAGRKAADVASRIEVDPNAVGSLLGNVRVKPEGIKAYHGSPHDFDKFSMDKIGTGEGAQAYGHGLYLAEAEDVAKKYRDDLSGWGTAGAQRTLEAVGGDVDRAISETQQKLSRLLERNESGAFEGAERNFNMQRQIQKDKIHQLESYRDKGSFDAGHLYEVNIAASPDDFLDYDAPLTGQTGKVAEYISSYEALTGQPILEALPDRELTGKDLYTSLVGKDMRGSGTDSYNKSAPSASKYLFSEGVPGIKYKDAGSRGTDAATQNFVVFDDNLISIVKKYGIAGAAAMLGVATIDVEQAMAQGAPQDSGLLALREEQKRANEEQYKRGLLQ